VSGIRIQGHCEFTAIMARYSKHELSKKDLDRIVVASVAANAAMQKKMEKEGDTI